MKYLDRGRTNLPREELFEKDDFAGRIDILLACCHRCDEDISSRQPSVGVILQFPKELFASKERCFGELGLDTMEVRNDI